MVENSDVASSLQEEGVVYLNNAGQAKLSLSAQHAGLQALTRDPSPQQNADAAAQQARVRVLFAQLIGAESADDIAIHPSTAFCITMIAERVWRKFVVNRYDLPPRKGRILVLEDQFCSAVYPWQAICDRSTDVLSLEIVPCPQDNGNWTDAVLEKLVDDNDIPIIATCLPPLHWTDGSLLDLKRIGDTCRHHGILWTVDATQAVGILPCTLESCGQPTVLAASTHKWLRGPSGFSLAYIDKNCWKQMQPLDQHGRGRQVITTSEWETTRHEMGPRGYPVEFLPSARKFDGGGKPNPVLLPVLCAALEEVVQLDLTQAQASLQTVLQPLLDWARQNGYVVPRDHAYHLVGIRPPRLSPDQVLTIGQELANEGIHLAVRASGFRISPYLDTTPNDIQRLIQALTDKTAYEEMSRSNVM